MHAQKGVGQGKNLQSWQVRPAATPLSSDSDRVLVLTGSFGRWEGCEASGPAEVSPAVLPVPLPVALSPETSRRCPLNG